MTKIQIIVNYYFKLKNWNDKDKDFYIRNGIKYPRYVRPAQRLLAKCRGDVQLAKDKLWYLSRWAKENNLSWAIETVLKRWDEDSGRVEQDIKSEEIAEERSSQGFTAQELKENLNKLNQMKLVLGGKNS